MNEVKVIQLFEKYPKLEVFVAAGTISLKAARTILDIDRWLMYDIFVELIEAQAVFPQGSTTWRATPELKKFLEVRKNGNKPE